MNFPMTRRQTAVLAAILCGTTASADVTAQQVWDNWSAQTKMYGDGFTTGEQVMSGDTLTISDVRINVSDEEAAVTADLGDIALTENGDGTVTVTMAQDYPITINVTPTFEDPSVINAAVRQSNMVLTVSGDPDAMRYDVSADAYTISIDSLEGLAASEATLNDAMIALIDVAGTYSVNAGSISTGNLSNIVYDMTVGALDVDVDFAVTETGGYMRLNADLASLAMNADITAPVGMDMNAEDPPFAEGLAFVGGYSFGEAAYEMDFDIEGDAMTATAGAQNGSLEFKFDLDGFAYIAETTGIVISALLPNEMPFPLEATLGKYGFDIQIPLSQGEDGPRDARVAFNLTDLAISDTIWNLADPANILPRDPITVAIGMDAQVTPFFDFLDPAQQQAAMMSDVPGELNNAQITELTVRGAGAEITGEGAFTFDNSDLTTFDGLPRPEGQVSFAINGINGLVDNLIQMGVVPQDQAMMPRMMMGMFATPVGDDMLTSTIEVNSEGHVLANGQRLR